MTTQPAIRVRGLTKRYGLAPALNGLDLDLPAGRIVALLGENGSGKTTLLKILAGVLADHEGEALLHGLPPGPETKAFVSHLPDADFLPSHLRAREAIDIYARFFPDFDQEKAEGILERFRLSPDQRLRQMSKGMREKVRIALAISRKARVYLLDEPISGVDPAARADILEGIIGNYEPDSLLLISTHLVADIEQLADGVVFLRAGRVLMAGDVDDIRQTHGMGLDSIFRREYRDVR